MKNKLILCGVLIFLISIFSLILVSAENIPISSLEKEMKESSYIITNSNDWMDVYSTMLISKLLADKQAQYIINREHGLIIPSQLDKNLGKALVIESSDNYLIKGFHNNLESSGIITNNYQYKNNANLEFLKQYDFNKYIIVDSAYSYNAVSIIPYAAKEGYYVVFIGEGDITDVIDALNNKRIEEMVVYGYISRDSLNLLKEIKSDLTVIDKGSKYDNNLEIVKLFSKNYEVKQIILSNGDFFEPQFFTGETPVLFIGTSNTPQEIIDYIIQNNIKYGTLIGNDLYATAKTLKDKTGMKVMVKFAKGINQEQFSLDIYNLPVPKFNVIVEKVEYNIVTKELEITYKNLEDYPAFAKSDFEILLDGASIAVDGDEEPFFIERKSSKTIAYDIDIVEQTGKSVLSRISLVFGEDEKSMEFLSQADYKIDFVEIVDNSNIEISGVKYDKPTKRFEIKIKNTGKDTLYTIPELNEIIVDGKKINIAADLSKKIIPGESEDFQIKAKLTDEDILDNSKIIVKARYGVRDNALTKEKTGVFDMDISYLSKDAVIVVSIIVIVIIVLIAIVIVSSRKKRKYHHMPPVKKNN